MGIFFSNNKAERNNLNDIEWQKTPYYQSNPQEEQTAGVHHTFPTGILAYIVNQCFL